jgi:3-dehydroquinate synthase
MKVILVPTTVLGVVDSSIGGKTAVNFVAKNTVGTFSPAKKIIVVKELFESLPDDLIAGGKTEIIKVMLLTGSTDLFKENVDLLSENSLETAMNDKYSIVAEDLDDTLGKRIYLNWGHTFGHAIERFYGLSHGLAVANGMILIQLYMEFLGVKCFDYKLLLQLFDKYKINVSYHDYLKEDGWKKFIKFDKKRDSEEISLVYLEKSGYPQIINRNLNDILKDLEEMR